MAKGEELGGVQLATSSLLLLRGEWLFLERTRDLNLDSYHSLSPRYIRRVTYDSDPAQKIPTMSLQYPLRTAGSYSILQVLQTDGKTARKVLSRLRFQMPS